MANGQEGQSKSGSCGAVSQRLGEVLEKLEYASALISLEINDELAGSNDRCTLEGLYCAKGGVTCAIEESRKRRARDCFYQPLNS